MVYGGEHADKADGGAELPDGLCESGKNGGDPDAEMIDNHHQGTRITVRQLRGHGCHTAEKHESGHPVDDDLLVTHPEIPARIIGGLGEDQHDKVI